MRRGRRGDTVVRSAFFNLKKREDDVVLLLYVVSLSTALALLRALVRVIYLHLPILYHIMHSPNGSPVGARWELELSFTNLTRTGVPHGRTHAFAASPGK